MKLFLDIVAFGNSTKDLAEALEHAAGQLRMGTKSESITLEGENPSDELHVTFDIRDTSVSPWKEKLEAYVNS